MSITAITLKIPAWTILSTIENLNNNRREWGIRRGATTDYLEEYPQLLQAFQKADLGWARAAVVRFGQSERSPGNGQCRGKCWEPPLSASAADNSPEPTG